MKYSPSNKPLVCMQTQSACYKGTRNMTVKGILWHSTGANNPNLKRYIQPSDVKPSADTYTKAEWLQKLGTNNNNNDWNHTDRQAGLNCWIGKLADGTVATVQTMPWDFRPWGCGSGNKGSCNDGWIQFEICEDSLSDKNYFSQIYKEACEITAYLCKLYNINPNGTVIHKGITVPTILCHQDSYRLGLGSNHGDILHWFPKYGKTMESIRTDVAALLKGANFDYSLPASSQNESSTSVKPIESILIREFLVKNIDINSAIIKLSTSENFKKYSWSYNLTSLKTTGSTFTSSIKVPKGQTEVILKNLIPNNTYSLEIIAKDTFNTTIKSPAIVFSTPQDYPQNVENVQFEIDTANLLEGNCKFSFKPPASWGSAKRKNKGYRISLFINGYEQGHDDNLITAKTSSKTLKLSNLLNKLDIDTLHFNDIIQIGVQPWVVDEQNNLVFAATLPKCSKPIYLKAILQQIDKIFVATEDGYKYAMIYSTK